MKALIKSCRAVQYYPIQIHYTGKRPDDDYERIDKVTMTYYFDKQTNTYIKQP